MKKTAIIVSICAVFMGLFSCVSNDKIEISFKDVEKYSMYDYIVQRPDSFSSFLSILQAGGLDKTMSAYNPNGDGYTMFLPDNAAIDAFIAQSEEYSSLTDLLNDTEFVWYFCRYHVVNEKINSDDFPFGALDDFTLTEDYLTISFIVEEDSSYYKVNNQAPVSVTNIEMSNGYIHLLSAALTPITSTTYDWLAEQPGYSIFKDAADATGLNVLLSTNPKIDEEALPFTLFLEHDSIYQKRGINSFEDLAEIISPDRTNYTDPLNPMFNYVAYHILTENRFLDDFAEFSTNYSTYSDVPVHVNGTGIDILINKGKETFDTLVDGTDTTFINYIGIFYDASNVITQSGSIHFIDQVMKQQPPSMAVQTYEVYDRPFFDEFAMEPGEYLIMDSTALRSISYSGSELIYVKEAEVDAPNNLWGDDYIMVEGDFTVSFDIPKLVQGAYTIFMQANTENDANALVEIFVDGKLLKSVDLANTGSPSADEPFIQFELGEMEFVRYEAHTITVKALVPGKFSWDYIRFEPL